MTTDWRDHLEQHLDLNREVLEFVGKRLEVLKSGEHIQTVAFSKEVAKHFEAKAKMTDAQMYNVIRPFLVEFPGIECRKGPKGGIYKL